jgi:hypothetical protein
MLDHVYSRPMFDPAQVADHPSGAHQGQGGAAGGVQLLLLGPADATGPPSTKVRRRLLSLFTSRRVCTLGLGDQLPAASSTASCCAPLKLGVCVAVANRAGLGPLCSHWIRLLSF